ncbi:hypothetical protein FRC03_004456 [Tulasnella sp. 419]|nr:hypothetical protein FRC02_003720 [Tulasnella sp. 418]KAG8962258.1 hypothetical protein FRC03_004456 [Tulasnella sp. 419]
MSTLNVLTTAYHKLLAKLPSSRPVPTLDIISLVQDTIKSTNSATRHSEWELVLKKDILQLMTGEQEALENPQTTYYQDLMDRLDIVLAFTELGAGDSGLPLNIFEELIDAHTVASCMRLFSWLELRTDRIVVGMSPQRGKGPVLLRSLNNLLRKISKTGSTTQFCGRILIFLSIVFPFGERSGVNLRGEYGPPWTPVSITVPLNESMEGVETADPAERELLVRQAETIKKVEFYNNFWSLQTFFARPQTFAQKDALADFRARVEVVLTALIEATRNEQAMMGSRSTVNASVFSKVPGVIEQDTVGRHHSSAKFLTSPELLEFELADTMFRRQVLLQLLILIRHLVTFTESQKRAWQSARNASLHMDLVVSDEEHTWLQDIHARAMTELRNTVPNGKTFADTVSVLLERDKNWVKWKNDVCSALDKTAKAAREPLKDTDIQAQENSSWEKVFGSSDDAEQDMPVLYGSENLDEIWTYGFRELDELENPEELGNIISFQKQIKGQEMRKDMERKRKGLKPQSRPAIPQKAAGTITEGSGPSNNESSSAQPVSLKPQEVFALAPQEEDPKLQEFDMNVQSLTWRCLRLAVQQGHLHHFNKISGGNVDLLVKEISSPPPNHAGGTDKAQSSQSSRGDVALSMAASDPDVGVTQPPSQADPEAQAPQPDTLMSVD